MIEAHRTFPAAGLVGSRDKPQTKSDPEGLHGSSATGEIRDLTEGSVQTIDLLRIAIRGATLRVFLDSVQLPSRGAQLARYWFALWTLTPPGTDIATVASFAPDASMIPIAVLHNANVRR